jgi:hypothetical protein
MSMQNREVIKSALSEFSMAINQVVLNLTVNLRQGVQQQHAHAESVPMGCSEPSTSKGTRELRRKRKHDGLEEPIDEVRSDEETSSSDHELEHYCDSESCGEDRDEVDGNRYDDEDNTTGSQSHPRGTEKQGSKHFRHKVVASCA